MIRAATADDAVAIAAIYAPHVLAGTASFEETPPDAAAITARMAASAGLYPWLVWAEEDAPALAYAYASAWSPRPAYRWAAETTIYVADAAHGRGIGRRLYAALLATLTAQELTEAIGRIALPNPASVALHEALGFAAAGVLPRIGWKQGRWVDVGQWRRPLAAPAGAPPEPRRFADLDGEPRWPG